MGDRVKTVHHVGTGVAVSRELVAEALAVLIHPDEGRRHHLNLHGSLAARELAAERAGVGGHVPETGAGRLSEADAVTSVARVAESVELVALGESGEGFLIKLIAAAGKDHGALRLDVDFLAVGHRDNADHFVAVLDQLLHRGVQHDRNAAVFFDGVAVEVKETVAAALLAADAPLVNRFPALQILEPGVAVDPELGVRLKTFHKALHAHDLFAEDLEKFRILFRIREVIRRVEIGEGVSFVLRDHEAAGGNRGVAAALLHLFDDQHLRARVMRGDSGTGAGTAVADHENIGLLIPADVLGIGFRDSAGKRKGRNSGSTALKQISAVEIHNFSPGVGVSKKTITELSRKTHGTDRRRASGAYVPDDTRCRR